MTYRWDKLATYNSELARGITHTEEWKAEMAEQQRQFDSERDAEMVARGASRVDGGWLVIPREKTPRRWWWR